MTLSPTFPRALLVAVAVLAGGCGRGEPYVPFLDWGAPDAGPDVADVPAARDDRGDAGFEPDRGGDENDAPLLPDDGGFDVVPPQDADDLPDAAFPPDAHDVAPPVDAADTFVPQDAPGPDASDIAPPPDVRDVPPPADVHEIVAGPDDGPAEHGPCTDTLGSALTPTFGRLDGILTSIVLPGETGCNADESHLHLQVRVDGAVYDVAVNVGYSTFSDVYHDDWDGPLVDGAWDEGWHPDVSLDYAALGLRSGDFAATTQASLLADLDVDLAGANHVSIFGTAYGPDGVHLIHREGGGQDGAIVVDPLAPTSRFLLFRFVDQAF